MDADKELENRISEAIAAAVAAEREACAKIAGDKASWYSEASRKADGVNRAQRVAQMDAADEIYTAIRARGAQGKVN